LLGNIAEKHSRGYKQRQAVTDYIFVSYFGSLLLFGFGQEIDAGCLRDAWKPHDMATFY
jgi:hypothetical protein